ncbi:MAG: hypothetical protein KGH88_02945 [Thaumarchaeota archaeon]|nr:hypothetical protein [Nitrososphaerota archaeon]
MFAVHSNAYILIKSRKNNLVVTRMASSNKLELLNFFGVKSSRKHVLICLRCGSDHIQREENAIKCVDCNKIISVKS